MTTRRHKVFVSFHHGDPAIDPNCRQRWEERFENLFDGHRNISKPVQDGDIKDGVATEHTRQRIRDEYIADATVTVVLIRPVTWKRRHFDWETSSSIRDTKNNPRYGLLGILLPTYPNYDRIENTYNPYTIHPRLYYNIKNGFANINVGSENPSYVQNWIHIAFERRTQIEPDNSYPLFSNNRQADQIQWQ